MPQNFSKKPDYGWDRSVDKKRCDSCNYKESAAVRDQIIGAHSLDLHNPPVWTGKKVTFAELSKENDTSKPSKSPLVLWEEDEDQVGKKDTSKTSFMIWEDDDEQEDESGKAGPSKSKKLLSMIREEDEDQI
jgi:hypothetical protein